MTMRRGEPANCITCGAIYYRHSVSHVYCAACSAERQAERQRKWAQQNPQSKEYRRGVGERRMSEARQYGQERSHHERVSIAWSASEPVDLAWFVRVSVPFEYSFSKNHLFTNRPGGHVALRKDSRAVRDNLTLELKLALRSASIQPVPGKLWIDLFVQKSNHRGDAVNVIDLTCDAIKDAAGVDDRWFSIRRLDWQIVKIDPRIYVSIGQETTEPMQCCSRCGRELPYAAFNKSRAMKLGVTRTCRECQSSGRVKVARLEEDE